jgi:hypothetical protein
MFAGSILELPCYATITVTPKRVTNAACRCHVFTIADVLSIAGELDFRSCAASNCTRRD